MASEAEHVVIIFCRYCLDKPDAENHVKFSNTLYEFFKDTCAHSNEAAFVEPKQSLGIRLKTELGEVETLKPGQSKSTPRH